MNENASTSAGGPSTAVRPKPAQKQNNQGNPTRENNSASVPNGNIKVNPIPPPVQSGKGTLGPTLDPSIPLNPVKVNQGATQGSSKSTTGSGKASTGKAKETKKAPPGANPHDSYQLLPNSECWKEAKWSRRRMPHAQAVRFLETHKDCAEMYAKGRIRECLLTAQDPTWMNRPEEYNVELLQEHPEYFQRKKDQELFVNMLSFDTKISIFY